MMEKIFGLFNCYKKIWMNDRTEIFATLIFFEAATDWKIDQANQSIDGFQLYTL